MANSRSSKKRIKINKRNNIQNNSYKSLIKTSEKKLLTLIKQDRDKQDDKTQFRINQLFTLAISSIDKAVKKNIIHKNTAARKKSNLYKNTFPLNK
uniref:30S ribosomal protein S20 n=1 Tax=Sporochnus bolleanus TaxID=461143 RepID=UPI002E7820E4|nr:30S ribosomal protein S20 [Sporochnus bolleanus]WAM64912.1 30S ribosomal protein S20 [Sporochnus bolleanus]